MAKTKILYLISSLAQGGAERHLVELVRGLDPGRFETEICVLGDKTHFKGELPEGQPSHRLRAHAWASPVAFARLVATVRAVRPTILHTYMNDANLWGRLATWFGPRPRIITSVHLDDMPIVYRWLERPLSRRADRIVAHSRSIERLLVDGLGVPRARVTLIPNGVDVERFQPLTVAARQNARQTQGIDARAFVALMPARISPQKNQDLVIEALSRLRASGELPETFRLLLAGRVSSARYARKLRSSIEGAGLSGQVKLLGAVREMRELYAAADVVLMPSRTEASPIAALEALACGVPVLISAAANTDAVLVDGQHGWQIDLATPVAIANALREILATPAENLRFKGAAAREHVLLRFSSKRVVDDFVRLYEALSPPSA